MTDIFTAMELRSLLEQRETKSISLYMSTHPGTPEVRADPIRFKNLLNAAEARLINGGMRAPEARQLLQKAHVVRRDRTFWEQQAKGLAMFISPTQFRHFRLPLEFGEAVMVAESFHIKALLPLLMQGGRFYILSLGLKGVRMYECTRFSISELLLPGLPLSLADLEEGFEPVERRFYSGSSATRRAGLATFHGRGLEEETRDARIVEFFNDVDKSVRGTLRDHRPPIILAGVDYLFPLYRLTAQYTNIMDAGIEGSADDFSTQELHERGWRLIEPAFTKARETALDDYHRHEKSGRVSVRIEEILPAAREGRVARLFVAPEQQVWGNYDPQTGEVLALHQRFEAEDVDLLDMASAETLLRKGEVFPLSPGQGPDGAPHAAIFRR